MAYTNKGEVERNGNKLRVINHINLEPLSTVNAFFGGTHLGIYGSIKHFSNHLIRKNKIQYRLGQLMNIMQTHEHDE